MGKAKDVPASVALAPFDSVFAPEMSTVRSAWSPTSTAIAGFTRIRFSAELDVKLLAALKLDDALQVPSKLETWDTLTAKWGRSKNIPAVITPGSPRMSIPSSNSGRTLRPSSRLASGVVEFRGSGVIWEFELSKMQAAENIKDS